MLAKHFGCTCWYSKKDRFAALTAAQGWQEALDQPETVRAWIGQQIQGGQALSVRQALAMSKRLERDTTDGVDGYADPETRQVSRGIETVKVWVSQSHRGSVSAYPIWLVKIGEETFHTHNVWGKDEAAERHAATREAIGAIRTRRELAGVDS